MLMTEASKKTNSALVHVFETPFPDIFILPLKRVLRIYDLLCFRKDQCKILALINLNNKVNAITLAYIAKLGLNVQKTDIVAQKINSSILDIFERVLVNFQIKDKLIRVWFFQKTFLVVNTNLEVVFGMLFLTFSYLNIQFT